MTQVLVICCLDGTPFVYPDGSIRVVVPGADVSVEDHGGQCEVRQMMLDAAPSGGHPLKRDSGLQARSEREVDG